jgi:hypothetical protein
MNQSQKRNLEHVAPAIVLVYALVVTYAVYGEDGPLRVAMIIVAIGLAVLASLFISLWAPWRRR